jgi:phosphohistidine swiveling domain-containing protein
MPTVTSHVPITMSAMQRSKLVPDVLRAFDAKMRCAHHGQMLTNAALVGDVLTCETCCQDVVADVQKALAILVRMAANTS